MDAENWIKDGTADAEPVTTETPAEVVEVAPEATTEQVGEAVEAGAETVEEVQAFIEGRMGDEPFQLPESVALPLKRGEEVEFVPVTELLKRGMMEKDYRIKTDELGRERRAFQTEQQRVTAERAKIEARAKYLEEKEAEIKAALTDPQSALAYEEHLKQYQTNPMYRKHVDTALASRETEAELNALRADSDERIVKEAASTAFGWINELAEEYPGVDPDRVRESYSQLLQSGRAQLDRAEVERIYRTEADYLARASTPLQQQLAALTARFEAMQAMTAAEQHNEKTAHALARAKAPKVAAGNGAPARTPAPATKFNPNELQERNAEWVRAG